MPNFDRLLDYIAILAWVIAGIGLVVGFVRISRHHGLKTAITRLFSTRILIPLAVAVGLTLVSMALVFIQPQEVGVVISLNSPRGVRDQTMRSGVHWIVPFLEHVVRYPIYWQTYTMSGKPFEGPQVGDDSIVARTSDGQEVSLDASIIFRIDPEQAVRIHIDWQERYIDSFVRPITRGIMRTQVSQFTVDEVNSRKRLDLEQTLDARIRGELEEKGFIFDQFVLRNITFSQEYAAAVERKQVALQDVTEKQYQAQQIKNLAEGQAKEITIRAAAEAEARLVQAKAEAEALKLIAGALAENPDLLTYRYIDKLSPAIRAMLVPSNAPFILPLPTLGPDEPEPSPFDPNATPLPPESLLPEKIIIPTATITPTQTPGP